MGGLGSGRTATYSAKGTTEDSLPLDIRRMQRAGVLVPGRASSWQWTVGDRPRASIQIRADDWQVTLSYTYTPYGQPAESVSQTVRLETTPCTLGGHRQWFACPDCGQRVAVLYGVGRLFSCRRCKGLAFASQSVSADDRAARRANCIRKRLGWTAGFLNERGGKPKGMHWRTYRRLVVEHDALVALSMEGTARRLGRLERVLEHSRDRLAKLR